MSICPYIYIYIYISKNHQRDVTVTVSATSWRIEKKDNWVRKRYSCSVMLLRLQQNRRFPSYDEAIMDVYGQRLDRLVVITKPTPVSSETSRLEAVHSSIEISIVLF